MGLGENGENGKNDENRESHVQACSSQNVFCYVLFTFSFQIFSVFSLCPANP